MRAREREEAPLRRVGVESIGRKTEKKKTINSTHRALAVRYARGESAQVDDGLAEVVALEQALFAFFCALETRSAKRERIEVRRHCPSSADVEFGFASSPTFLLPFFTLTSSTTSPLSHSSARRAARTAVRDSGLAHGISVKKRKKR